LRIAALIPFTLYEIIFKFVNFNDSVLPKKIVEKFIAKNQILIFGLGKESILRATNINNIVFLPGTLSEIF
tara:strand:- start:306 stop:518 length:213 start_codon:yes stop_codon:yes gene_type:complete